MNLEIGKTVPEEVEKIFKRLLTVKDTIVIASEHELSEHTLQKIMYSRASITDTNYTMIGLMIKKMYENLESERMELERIIPQLELLQASYNNLNIKEAV